MVTAYVDGSLQNKYVYIIQKKKLPQKIQKKNKYKNRKSPHSK